MFQGSQETYAERVLVQPKKRSHWVPARIDGRLKVAKRSVQLARHYTEVLQKAGREVTSPDLATAICSAAELIALAEAERAKILRGGHVPLDHLSALQRLADQSVARLGLLPSAAPAPESEREPSVEQYIAEHYGKASSR
jgi:hypothetical protein